MYLGRFELQGLAVKASHCIAQGEYSGPGFEIYTYTYPVWCVFKIARIRIPFIIGAVKKYLKKGVQVEKVSKFNCEYAVCRCGDGFLVETSQRFKPANSEQLIVEKVFILEIAALVTYHERALPEQGNETLYNKLEAI